MTRQKISEQLQHWHDQAEQIMTLFDDRGQRVPATRQQQARAMLVTLKDQLETEYKRLSRMKVQESLTPDEQAFYRPAVDEGFNVLGKARRNSTPDIQWFTALDDVLICMRHHQPR